MVGDEVGDHAASPNQVDLGQDWTRVGEDGERLFARPSIERDIAKGLLKPRLRAQEAHCHPRFAQNGQRNDQARRAACRTSAAPTTS